MVAPSGKVRLRVRARVAVTVTVSLILTLTLTLTLGKAGRAPLRVRRRTPYSELLEILDDKVRYRGDIGEI